MMGQHSHHSILYSPLDGVAGGQLPAQTTGNGKGSAEGAVSIQELQRVNEELRQARRAALNLMEDAILAKEALRISEEKYRTKLEQEVRDRTAELAESKGLLQATMNASMDMIQVFEAVRNEVGEIVDFTYVLLNHEAEKWMPGALGKSLLQQQPGVVEEGIFDTFKKVVETGIPDQSERHYVHEQFNGWFFQSAVKMGDGVATTTTDITARKTAELELLRLKEETAQRAEDKYQAIFNSIDEGFSLLDIQFDENDKAYDIIIRDANPAQERIDGIRASIGKRVREILPDIEPKWIERYAAVATSGNPVNFEDWSESNQRWYKVNASRVGAAGSTLVATVYDDITERKLQEQRQAFLLKLNDALRLLSDPLEIQKVATELLGDHFDTARSYYMEIDEENHLATMRAETLRANVPSNIGVYDLTLFEKIIALLRSGQALVIKNWDESVKEEMKIGGDGKKVMTERQVVSQISVPIIKDGGLIATFTVLDNRPRNWTEQDVTLMFETAERTWEAVIRAKAEEALRLSEQRLQRMVNVPRVGLLTFSYEGEMLQANDAFLEMIGYSRSDFEKQRFTWHNFTPPEYVARSLEILEQLRETGIGGPYEKEYYRKDGSRVWLMFVAADLGDGTVAEYVIDRSESKKAEEALLQSQKEFQSIANLVPDLLWDSEPDGSTNWLNQRWLK